MSLLLANGLSSNFWDEWDKPWTVEQTRDRYVRGSKIGQIRLAKESGVGIGIIRRRSTEDNWVEDRERFIGKVRARSEQKAIEKISEKESEAIAKRYGEHLEAWESLRQVSKRAIDYVRLTVQAKETGKSISPEVESARDFLLSIGGKAPFSCHVNGLRTAITGERENEFMQYADVNVLSKYAEMHGYALVDEETGERVDTVEPVELQHTNDA